jgi:hypothetical protein
VRAVRAAVCGSAHGSVRTMRAVVCGSIVRLAVYGSARGSVRLSTSAEECGNNVWQCVAVCGRERGNVVVRGSARGSVWQCALYVCIHRVAHNVYWYAPIGAVGLRIFGAIAYGGGAGPASHTKIPPP